MKLKQIGKKMISLLFLVIAIVALIKAYEIYKERDFNEFIRAEKEPYSSTFSRDSKIKTGKYSSYKIESNSFNDAMFYKTIKVDPQTPYKVTCMVKTENVQKLENNFGGGAQISIEGTTERSNAISGTTDWTKLVLYFDSKNRTEVNIGFRLGGYDNNCTGKAWFSDITCESGVQNKSSEWKFVCFIFKNVDISLNQNGIQERVRLSITQDDINLINEDMMRFKNTCEDFSKNQMQVSFEIIEINDPITTISYDDENAYYINPTDVENLIDEYMQKKEYDHIFAVIRLGDISRNVEIPVNDWIGLGGMDYHNIGFANIRLPNDRNSYYYRYDYLTNQFPEEVFLHEFLHTLERNLIENGYEIPALHDNEKYGYKNEYLYGLSKWYKEYMRKNILSSRGEKVGLDSTVYTIKPVHESNFKYSYKINIAKEPENIIEEIRAVGEKVFKIISNLDKLDWNSIKLQI